MAVHYSAPGKLFVSGEWAILEMGTRGMVAAVNKRVHAKIESANKGIIVSIKDFSLHNLFSEFDGHNLIFEKKEHEKELQFIKESIETALRFLSEKRTEVRPFSITTWGEDTTVLIEGQRKKVGFGSSAAATVAVVAAVLDYHGYHAKEEEIYKLATIAHYFVQGKVGSAFDVAASTYGGLFVYSRFDPDWLTKKMETGEKIESIIKENWPGFLVEELAVPDTFRLLIGWTREEAATSPMIKQMNEFKKNNTDKYDRAIRSVSACAHNAIQAWNERDYERFVIELQNNASALSALGKVSGVNIETPDLAKLSELANSCGAAGKLSGAGGGDCGIAVCFDDETSKNVERLWRDAGFYLVDATIDREGVRKE